MRAAVGVSAPTVDGLAADTLQWRVGRALELLTEASAETFRGAPVGSPGYYAQLAGALEAQLDLVCESAQQILSRLGRLCRLC